MNINWIGMKSRIIDIKKRYQSKIYENNPYKINNSDDAEYRRYFLSTIGPEIYIQQMSNYFMCCAFCKNLKKSSCHEYCFTCSKKVYKECGELLPGTYEHVCNRLDNSGNDITPWIFKTPCTDYERLDLLKYFKFFTSPRHTVSISNYEALEGIFFGISRGKRPCHICASVNMDIYNSCSMNEKTIEESACSKILGEISNKYSAIFGMIKYPD